MFSISAINDTDSKQQWEPLAPTKEAQEFHVTQLYHEGLLKLQAKEYDQARQLLESVLKDPLISISQVNGNASDDHLQQLRFLALKNLATVFLEQGSTHYENALNCYLQAVEIDSKDFVIWNQLGTLSCSMGLLSISRWAFEQGLLCSPNNWNCMEKLLEVLIAIGDEVACFSVAELILRHWPSHSRASYVKKTIEESEPVPFAPRGIDKLEPKHVRLKFIDKRKATDESIAEGVACKRLNQNMELCLPEASWSALADALLEILCPLHGCGPEKGAQKEFTSGDVRLTIHISSRMNSVTGSIDDKGPHPVSSESLLVGDCNSERANFVKEREANTFEEQPHERRSTRLERLRSRKPGKEEFDFAASKDLAKVVLQLLEPFVIGGVRSKDFEQAACHSVSCLSQANSLDAEHTDISAFVRESSKNFGAYHMGHLLLEHAATRGFAYQDAFVKLLELERLTRHWGQDRTPECSLFLAELYYELGSLRSNALKLQEFMSEASYHLCKIIESVALSYPFSSNQISGSESFSSPKSFQDNNELFAKNSSCQDSFFSSSLVTNKIPFWVRYFWLSGKLSIFDCNKAKAHEEFCISLSLLVKQEEMNDSPCSVHLPHLKINKDITANRVLHEINLLKVDFLLDKTAGEMIEKEMYMEFIDLFSPLLFSTEHANIDVLPAPTSDEKGEEYACIELSAINLLIKAFEKAKPMNIEVYLNCHRRKLQILMLAAGMVEYETLRQKSGLKAFSASGIISKENSDKNWHDLVAEEVKVISLNVSQLKTDPSLNSNGVIFPMSCVSSIQTLLLSFMCHVAINFLSKQSSAPVFADQIEQKQGFSFVDAGIAFCKLQHLIPTVTVKTQVELIVAIHDLLAEYGLCCAGEGSKGEEGAFLRFAIKHLLALDMKLKSSLNSSNKETVEHNQQLSPHSENKTPEKELKSVTMDVEMGGAETDETINVEKDVLEGMSSLQHPEKDSTGMGCEKQGGDEGKIKIKGENMTEQFTESGNELTEDEREELELILDNALDQCFFCLYGLNLRSDSSYEDDLAMHKNTSRGDYQTKEQCADVFQYILPYAKASSKTGLVKLRRVLRAIRKHFPQPPDDVLTGNAIDKFLDDPDLCEDKLSEEAGSEGFLETITKKIFADVGCVKQHKSVIAGRSEPYLDIYCNLYYFLALSEEMSATDKWPGFVLTKEGEEFVQQNANLFKYDLLYNPLRFESWQRLANIYDEEVDLLLNDGSKHINAAGWRKNAALPQRVETSRRRSRRCLFVSLALAQTSAQQCEIHELLALVYYDGLQNVVPFYDQRSVVPTKDAAWMAFCENSLKHFKKASLHKQDWSHAFYMGKLCEKLGYSYDTSLSHYDNAISLNPSAVDPVYRMHASRLKLLCMCGKQNLEALKVLSGFAFSQSIKDAATDILDKLAPEMSHFPDDLKDRSTQEESVERKREELIRMEDVWNMLYNDCLSALEICVEGDLKHFHKARYMLAQGLYRRRLQGDLEKAKEELSFCFKSSRSSFTINMWEIDSIVKKGRRKTSGITGNKKALEVNLPESSRKFITCIRKYLLFYLKLLEETGDICTLDRAFISLRADKRFSLCIEDVVPLALGRLIKALVLSMHPDDSCAPGSSEHQLEKLFSLFIEQGNLWPEIFHLPEIRGPEISERNLYGYLHVYIASLEKNVKLETLEAINEKIRKRFKNPKLSNSNCARVCRHASVAWCRSLIINLALITPLRPALSREIQTLNPQDSVRENGPLLCVDLQTNEFWNSSLEDSLENLETKWNPVLTNIKNIFIEKTSDENFETANSLLKSSYNFFRESACVMLPSGLNLYLVPTRVSMGTQLQGGLNGVEVLDLSIPRKLLLWAYTLVHGRYANIAIVLKHCEENVKPKMKKGAGTSYVPSNANLPTVTALHTAVGGAKDGASHGGGSEQETVLMTPGSSSERENTQWLNPTPPSSEKQKSIHAPSQPNSVNNMTPAEGSCTIHEAGDPERG